MSSTHDGPSDQDGTDETRYTGERSGVDNTTHDSTAGSEGTAAETVRHEERLNIETETVDAGSVHVRKHVETHPVEYSVPRDVEHVDTSGRIAAEEGDSGEVVVLEDGSVSIPVFEEILVVTKRLVVRERVIVRKHTVVDEYKLQTELRREHVSVDADDSINVVDNLTADKSSNDSDDVRASDEGSA